MGRLIHTSDWHLGARLHDQDRTDEQAQFLRDLVEILRHDGAAVLLISGDVFDLRQPGPAAQQLYYDFLAEVDERCPCCRKVIITAGNHDSASLLAASGRALKRLGVAVVAKASEDVTREVIVVPDDAGAPLVAVAAIPFMNDGELANFARATGEAFATTAEKLAAGFRAHCAAVIAAAKEAAQDAPVVVMAHCTVSGARVSDARSERGRTIGGLESQEPLAFAGADYVALGHLHIPQRVGCDDRIVYSGSPLQMSFSEVGQRKRVVAVTFGATRGDRIETTDVELKASVPLHVLEGSAETIRRALLELKATAPERVYISLRVTEGEGELAPFWSEVDALVQGTGLRVLVRENARPHAAAGSGLAAAAEKTLSAMTPIEVATLRINEETDLTEAERAEYVAMVAEVIGGLA